MVIDLLFRQMESLVVKLDISKAYDKVSWDFLEVIMQKMLFPVPFIRILLRYVQSMEFQILLDGFPRMPFFSLEMSPRRSPLSFFCYHCVRKFSGLIRSHVHPGL